MTSCLEANTEDYQQKCGCAVWLRVDIPKVRSPDNLHYKRLITIVSYRYRITCTLHTFLYPGQDHYWSWRQRPAVQCNECLERWELSVSVVRNVNNVSKSVKVKKVVTVGIGQVVIANVITIFLTATKYIKAEAYDTEFPNIEQLP